MHQALTMTSDEQGERMRGMRMRVFDADVHAWARSFLDALTAPRGPREDRAQGTLHQLLQLVAGARARRATLVLDYDGTLVPFADRPERAKPDAELLTLLGALAARLETRLFIVSGRSREHMEEWLGHLDAALHAEHGLWTRAAGGREWRRTMSGPAAWRERVRAVLDHFVSTTRGSFVEEKTLGLAWHYRAARGDHTEGMEFGEYQANELQLVLTDLLRNEPVQVIHGHKVVEVRPAGVHKGIGMQGMAATLQAGELVLAIGDDATDEDLFEALPEGSVTVRVGDEPTRALYRIESHEDARRVLAALLD
jgi:trehalose 6-phosphate synthase/phosphatase